LPLFLFKKTAFIFKNSSRIKVRLSGDNITAMEKSII